MRYPADPPTVEEIVAVMRQAGAGRSAARMRALIVVLWRAGLRISEALMLNETDLDPSGGSILVRVGKGGRRREVGMDAWAWEREALQTTLPCDPDDTRLVDWMADERLGGRADRACIRVARPRRIARAG
jgi:site-specific recombinase XerC